MFTAIAIVTVSSFFALCLGYAVHKSISESRRIRAARRNAK